MQFRCKFKNGKCIPFFYFRKSSFFFKYKIYKIAIILFCLI